MDANYDEKMFLDPAALENGDGEKMIGKAINEGILSVIQQL